MDLEKFKIKKNKYSNDIFFIYLQDFFYNKMNDVRKSINGTRKTNDDARKGCNSVQC